MPQGKTSDQVSISMDWMPTLLAAAGGSPDPAYPLDGINLLPMLTGARRSTAHAVLALQANAQRAMRDGDMKYLKILDNTFLFNVAEDPMERANLKERQKDLYERLVTKWLNGIRRCCRKWTRAPPAETRERTRRTTSARRPPRVQR